MKKKYALTFFILLLVLVGCKADKDISFDDRNIKFKLIHSSSDKESKSYDIEITNAGEIEISYLQFYLHFPILTANGSESNPFKIEGKTEQRKPVKLKPGESVIYQIYAPIKQVYGDSKLLDFEDPSIELYGFTKNGADEIPFSMVGGLSVFIRYNID